MTRPKWYDDQVVAYSKILKKKISKYGDMFDKEAFFQDVMIYAFEHWEEYKPEYSFGTWMGLCFRNILSENKRVSRTQKGQFKTVELTEDVFASVDPNQHHITELKQTIDLIPKTRNGRIFLSTANEGSCRQTAKEFGLSGARVGVIVQKERAKLIERMEKTTRDNPKILPRGGN